MFFVKEGIVMKNVSRCVLFTVVFTVIGVFLLSGGQVTAATINVASVYPPGSPAHQGIEKFKAIVEEKSGGKFEVLIHPSGAMGGERDTFESLSNGSIECGAIGTGDVATFFPKYAVFEVPYVLRDEDHFWKFWDGPGKELNEMILQKKGVMTVGTVIRGARYLTANRPIESVADVKGLKMRLPEVKSWFKVWEELGALPTAVDFSEVYMALKTGVVEAQENPPETIFSYKFYEAQKYLIATKHIYSSARYQVSKAWLDTLDPADQEMILNAWKEATEYANSIAEVGDEKFVKELQEKGMTLIEPDLSAFQKAVQPVLEEMSKEMWNTEFFKKVVAIQ
jgi:tripartite ATP-independent transporter DctP family solute receptor